MKVSEIRKIESWHENGTDIWFYFKNSPKKHGVSKSFRVPKDIVESIRLSAINDFKKQLKHILEPDNPS